MRSGLARDVRAGKCQCREPAGLAAQQRINRQQAKQRQQPRKLKFKFAVHFRVQPLERAVSRAALFDLRNQFQRAIRGVERRGETDRRKFPLVALAQKTGNGLRQLRADFFAAGDGGAKFRRGQFAAGQFKRGDNITAQDLRDFAQKFSVFRLAQQLGQRVARQNFRRQHHRRFGPQPDPQKQKRNARARQNRRRQSRIHAVPKTSAAFRR